MNQLRDNTARTKQIISIFRIMSALAVVNIGSLVWRYFLLTDVQADADNADMNMVKVSDTLIAGVNVAHIIIVILSIVLFIMWFRKLRPIAFFPTTIHHQQKI